VASRPNIVLIVSDQQRYDSLACNGNRFVETPCLDRLAAEGARFTQGFTPWPVCSPARATMWTGVYPHAHGITRNVRGTEDALHAVARVSSTMFDLLRAEGYATAYFGKWALGTGDPGLFDVWDAFSSQTGYWVRVDGERRYRPDVQTDRSIDYLRGAVAARRPFIMVQAYFPPHDPYTAPAPFYVPYRGRGVPFPGYYAAVSNIDSNIGRIVRAIDDLGAGEDTVIVFCSDHGDTFFARAEGEHNAVCFEEAIHIPLVMRCPGRIRAGVAVGPPVGLQDLMPTVLDLAGCDAPAYLHGHTVRPWLEGGALPWRDAFYVETVTKRSGYVQRCIRTDGWKLILSEGGPQALYRLEDDPEEDRNLFDAPRDDRRADAAPIASHAVEIRDLAARLRACAIAIDDPTGVELAERVLP
jgi:choline-sulfatase